jgi:hypothetical protein
MDDGHSGIENRPVKQGGSGNFQLVLAYLKQGTGQGEFVIHATSNTSYSCGLQPLEFLSEIGLRHYQGQCRFHRDKCFYKAVVVYPREVPGFQYYDQAELVHHAFEAFAGRIGELFQLRQQEDRILREIGLDPSRRALFGQPIEVEISEKDIPLWVNEVKFPSLRELEKQRGAIQKEIDELSGFLPLLYGTGNALEEAVIKALQFLGLDAQHAPEGCTIDILAQTRDGLRKFGLEVTGISGSVKKDSVKLTQLVGFELIKEHGEKTILVANTYKTTPVAEREGLEDFTPQVLDFLSCHSILLMTGWNLYCIVRGVLENSRKREEIIETLHTTSGKLQLVQLPIR